jgi:hypothetical protein
MALERGNEREGEIMRMEGRYRKVFEISEFEQYFRI